MAPYEVAQSNGTVALLEENRIHDYNRVSSARQVLLIARDPYLHGGGATRERSAALRRFRWLQAMNAVTSATDITTLSKTELVEYRERIADPIAATDELRARMEFFDLEVQSLLNGAVSETQLLEESPKVHPHGFGVARAEIPGQ